MIDLSIFYLTRCGRWRTNFDLIFVKMVALRECHLYVCVCVCAFRYSAAWWRRRPTDRPNEQHNILCQNQMSLSVCQFRMHLWKQLERLQIRPKKENKTVFQIYVQNDLFKITDSIILYLKKIFFSFQ